MLISHEVPIDLLERSKAFNDYDYCLLHLTYQFPEYKKFYTKSTRPVLLDNSLFELGESLSNEQFAKGVFEIEPTWYVVPDCLNDVEGTIRKFQDFKKEYKNLPGKAIGVIQGKTVEELIYCYSFMKEEADKIAIPFESAAFKELSIKPDDNLYTRSTGRPKLVEILSQSNIWDSDKPHHLLGCSLASEFLSPVYRGVKIESVDTSNPIVSAIKGLRYEGVKGLSTKPTVKLCDLIEQKVPENSELEELLLYNVKQFRKICNGEINA